MIDRRIYPAAVAIFGIKHGQPRHEPVARVGGRVRVPFPGEALQQQRFRLADGLQA